VKRKQEEFFDLAERFRSTTDPEQVKQLGDQIGRMIFGVVEQVLFCRRGRPRKPMACPTTDY
jgi:hypothetical protein